MSNEKYLPPSKRASQRSIREAFVQDEEPEKKPTVMFNVRIDEELHLAFKMQALKERSSMREIIEKLMRGYLAEQE